MINNDFDHFFSDKFYIEFHISRIIIQKIMEILFINYFFKITLMFTVFLYKKLKFFIKITYRF